MLEILSHDIPRIIADLFWFDETSPDESGQKIKKIRMVDYKKITLLPEGHSLSTKVSFHNNPIALQALILF
jgi:hypothetical protein